jgi:DNA-directed RNA polymerase specialized sigma24 family protein
MRTGKRTGPDRRGMCDGQEGNESECSIHRFLYWITPHPAEKRLRLIRTIDDCTARAVMQLPENQRGVLLLAHYEQMPLAEIAEVLDIELGAIKSRLQGFSFHNRGHDREGK